MPGRVHVLGNCMVDIRLELPHLPRPGETLVGADGRRAPGGKAVNQAVTAARAGARVRLCAPFGNDAAAEEVRRQLGREPLEELDAPCVPLPHDLALLLVMPNGENATVGTAACAQALRPERAAAFVAGAEPGDVVLLQGNLTQEATAAAARAAPPGTVVFNPSPLVWDAGSLLGACGLVVANKLEAWLLTGENDPASAAAALASGRDAVVTVGADGCFAAQRGAVRHWPAPAVAATDTSGCGDVFCGVLAAERAQGRLLGEAIGRAQGAAALAATRPGAFASIPEPDEI